MYSPAIPPLGIEPENALDRSLSGVLVRETLACLSHLVARIRPGIQRGLSAMMTE
jgi:hypothetical protein